MFQCFFDHTEPGRAKIASMHKSAPDIWEELPPFYDATVELSKKGWVTCSLTMHEYFLHKIDPYQYQPSGTPAQWNLIGGYKQLVLLPYSQK